MNSNKLFLLPLVILLPFACISWSHKFNKYIGQPTHYMSADICEMIKAEQYEEAEEYFNYLVDKKPYSIDGIRMLEAVYGQISSEKNIEKPLNKWCSKKSPHQSAFILRGLYHKHKAWLARGSGYAYTVSDEGWNLFRHRLELAKEDLEKAYSLNPNDPNSASSMIPVCMGLRCEEAEMEKWFQRAVAADPVAYDSYSGKLQFLNPKWRGTHEKYLQFADYCYQNSPPNSIVYKIMFDCLIEYSKKAGDVKKFFNKPQVKNTLNAIYKRVLADFPNSTSIRMDFAYVQYKLGKIDEAIRLQTEALGIDPDHSLLLLSRGNIYLDNKHDFKKAEIDYNKIIENNGESSAAYFRLGVINSRYYWNHEKAIDYYDKAIELDPKEISFFIERGYSKIRRNRDFKSALEDFNEAIKLDRLHVHANYFKAMCLHDLKRFDEAITYYRRAIELINEEEAKDDAGEVNKNQAKRLELNMNNYISLCQNKHTLTNN